MAASQSPYGDGGFAEFPGRLYPSECSGSDRKGGGQLDERATTREHRIASRGRLQHVGIAGLERNPREWRGGCCKWEVRLGTAPRIALGAVAIVVSPQLHLDTACRCNPSQITPPCLALASRWQLANLPLKCRSTANFLFISLAIAAAHAVVPPRDRGTKRGGN